jgi:mannose-1-phosphate guanylyltransferase/mannose-6-phosphate isomerase
MVEPLPVIPVVLSGGSGTRLWPLSRELFPKQLQRLCSDYSMLQDTVKRAGGAPIVVCNQEHRFIVAEQLREIDVEPRAIVIEPVGRNTAPAVAVAALMAEADPDALVLVMPSDHLVKDPAAFRRAVEIGLPVARAGRLVTFGIVPTAPNTGYGYIKRGDAIGSDGAAAIERFVEKPDLATATTYVESGQYLWNSGIFLFPVGLLLAEMERFRPDIVSGCRQALSTGQSDLFFYRLNPEIFAALSGQSIDHAVMERTDRAAVVPVEMGWSDIGSFTALWQESGPDADGNVLTGDVVALNTTGSFVRSDRPLVATIGVHNLVVVATADAVLVADKSHDQDVKLVVEQLKARGRAEATEPPRSWRPWGWFQTLDDGYRFRVKHIQVNPGSKLSLQKHWHRSEHWVVVTGTALVTCGDNSFVLRENESTFIPAGTAHRLENPGRVPLRMIEVQSGEYVGEDDIVRMDDDYGRVVP